MSVKQKEKIGIIGMGRFGKVLADILSDDYLISAFDPNVSEAIYGVQWVSLEEVLKEKTIFIAVPIREFKSLVTKMAPHVSAGTTVLDVCSVKVYPVTVMKEHLPEDVGIIGTHPLFGPDSINKPAGHNVVMTKTRDVNDVFDKWKAYFESKAFTVLEMTPEEHDRGAAKTQGITHFIGRALRDAGIESTKMDTLGFKDLVDVIDQTCNDSWELFMDLQNFNPYTMRVIDTVEKSIKQIKNKIIDRD